MSAPAARSRALKTQAVPPPSVGSAVLGAARSAALAIESGQTKPLTTQQQRNLAKETNRRGGPPRPQNLPKSDWAPVAGPNSGGNSVFLGRHGAAATEGVDPKQADPKTGIAPPRYGYLINGQPQKGSKINKKIQLFPSPGDKGAGASDFSPYAPRQLGSGRAV